MKKKYIKPTLKVEEFKAEDIIRTSGGGLVTQTIEEVYTYDSVFTIDLTK